jgi:hypothetical protein
MPKAFESMDLKEPSAEVPRILKQAGLEIDNVIEALEFLGNRAKSITYPDKEIALKENPEPHPANIIKINTAIIKGKDSINKFIGEIDDLVQCIERAKSSRVDINKQMPVLRAMLSNGNTQTLVSCLGHQIELEGNIRDFNTSALAKNSSANYAESSANLASTWITKVSEHLKGVREGVDESITAQGLVRSVAGVNVDEQRSLVDYSKSPTSTIRGKSVLLDKAPALETTDKKPLSKGVWAKLTSVFKKSTSPPVPLEWAENPAQILLTEESTAHKEPTASSKRFEDPLEYHPIKFGKDVDYNNLDVDKLVSRIRARSITARAEISPAATQSSSKTRGKSEIEA